MKTLIMLFIISFLGITGCESDDMNSTIPGGGAPGNGDDWLIPKSEVRDGGPGRDGIPALTNPQMISAQEASYLTENDLVLGFIDGDNAFAFPHDILDWHEIINVNTENHSFAVIYCPLTGTGIGWNREIEGTITTFGVSGLLYNTNIIPYDRKTRSNWSQLLLKSVNGELVGSSAETYNLVETTWNTWRSMYPNTKVVSTNTGHSRNYGRYPYGDYKTNNSLIFPVSYLDDQIHLKERVLAILKDGKVKVYRMEDFLNPLSVITDNFKGTQLVIAGSNNLNLMAAFNRLLPDGTTLDFQAVQNDLPIILLDNEGTKWDVFGLAISGPRTGQKLEPVTQMMGYWFSWPAFYPDVEIY